jgi:crotonobetainyl-CoA:carnitine CoA-transferase CaiB-like acyl-CoA transferase
MPEGPSNPRALAGIRVVALEASVSAPHCSRLLADLGAEVIKIEKPGEGDLVRQWDTAVRGLSSGYVWLNYNKRSLAIDVKKAGGRDVIERLANKADVFLENLAPGVAERLGFGAASLCANNPKLIYCSISGYGQDGPYKDVKAYDLLVQGEAGIIATTGSPDQPAKVSIPIADLAASMYATTAILAALLQRQTTGHGQVLDISMFESLLSWLAYYPHHYWHRGEEPSRMGMRHHFVTPYGPYKASDGVYVNLAVATARDWDIFCRRVIGRPELLTDDRFKDAEARRANRAVLEKFVEDIFATRPHEEWLPRLEQAALPHGLVRGIGEVLAHPQVGARGMIQQVDSPVGAVPVIGSALRLPGGAPRLDPIPALGQDSDTILKELGYGAEQIARLRQEGVI